MGLLLSPEVKMRPDGGRTILFSVNPSDGMHDGAFRFLYPQEAVMLSLFDGSRGLSDIKEAVSYLFSLEQNAASQAVEELLELPVSTERKISSLIVSCSELDMNTARFYDPASFVVPAHEVDLSDLRCKIPCYLLVETTMRCCTNCVYCYADRDGMVGKQELELSLIKRLVREAKECGIETIEFSGGDFFCREDAFDIVEYILALGMYPNIPTKYPLSREQVNLLAEMGLSTIQISIDAFSTDIVDSMMGVSGYGKKIFETLDYLGYAGIRVRTNTVLTPHNIRDAVGLIRHLVHLPQVFKCNVTCYSRSLYRHRDDLFCSPGEIKEFERELAEVRRERPDKPVFFSGAPIDPYQGDKDERAVAYWDRALCTANRRGVIVLPDGKVTICEELYFHDSYVIGDLTKQTLMEVWNSPKAFALAHPDQSLFHEGPCNDCPDFRRCHEGLGRCFREALKAYGYDRPYWPDPRCPRAQRGNRMV